TKITKITKKTFFLKLEELRVLRAFCVSRRRTQSLEKAGCLTRLRRSHRSPDQSSIGGRSYLRPGDRHCHSRPANHVATTMHNRTKGASAKPTARAPNTSTSIVQRHE